MIVPLQIGVWHVPQLPPPVQCANDTSVVSGLMPPATARRLSSLKVCSVSARMTSFFFTFLFMCSLSLGMAAPSASASTCTTRGPARFA